MSTPQKNRTRPTVRDPDRPLRYDTDATRLHLLPISSPTSPIPLQKNSPSATPPDSALSLSPSLALSTPEISAANHEPPPEGSQLAIAAVRLSVAGALPPRPRSPRAREGLQVEVFDDEAAEGGDV